ncbi:hypothetical protein CA264_09620 [Pontibacter actiniarum]|uniref:Uncharacterized protein n=2 Tax=Pontibacter actiniarum TaxID=323450 RepID=A0A1X9YS31_9BACT|nr:hypothetical protein CA264_09620 [Pontibacter actiniarum]
MSDKANGIYKLKSDTIYLAYNPEQPDEFIMSLPDSARQTFKALEVPNYAAANRPYKLLYRKEKLLEINEEGEVVRRKEGESRNRRWLLWGDYYMKKRKYYLEKRPGKTIVK